MNNEIKNVINNYYNIEISQVYCYDSYYVIFDNYNRLYFFVPFKRDEKDLDFLLNVISNCHKNKIYIHSFVYTNKGMLIVEVNEQRYNSAQ